MVDDETCPKGDRRYAYRGIREIDSGEILGRRVCALKYFLCGICVLRLLPYSSRAVTFKEMVLMKTGGSVGRRMPWQDGTNS